MVDDPGIQLEIRASQKREHHGDLSNRIREFTDSWLRFTGFQPGQEFAIRLLKAPESHVGLGTGTQLGLAVAAGLYHFHHGETPGVETLARSVGRGKRSAIGTHGFMLGGLIVDGGKEFADQIAQLDLHLQLPESWRLVLIQCRNQPGISGAEEEGIFQPDLPRGIERRKLLIEIARHQIIPAVLEGDFDLFCQSVHEFGKSSGAYFADIQGGPFNGKRITEIIELARSRGIQGIGQSSWGPTLYALARSEEHAEQIRHQMSEDLYEDETIIVTRPSQAGARIQIDEKSCKN